MYSILTNVNQAASKYRSSSLYSIGSSFSEVILHLLSVLITELLSHGLFGVTVRRSKADTKESFESESWFAKQNKHKKQNFIYFKNFITSALKMTNLNLKVHTRGF